MVRTIIKKIIYKKKKTVKFRQNVSVTIKGGVLLSHTCCGMYVNFCLVMKANLVENISA